MEKYGYSSLQNGFVDAKMGDFVPGGEESYPSNESCSNQGSWYPNVMAVGLEAKNGQAWIGMLDTDGNTLMILS